VQEFIDELEAYPRGEYSDRVSAFAHLLYWFHERMGKLQEDHADLLAVGANAAPAQQTRKWIF
jgi:hypothetical protein